MDWMYACVMRFDQGAEIMKKSLVKGTLQVALITAISIYSAKPFAQATVELMPAADSDLTAIQLQATEAGQLKNKSRNEASISWPLPSVRLLSESSRPHTASSREYWLTVNGLQLQQGLKLQTTAAGAIVKISPKPDQNIKPSKLPELDAGQLTIIDARGKQHPQMSAMANSATADQLNNARLSFPPGTVIFQLKETLGHGEFTVKSHNITDPQQRFLVYVLDKNSQYRLSVKTDDDTVFSGQQLVAQIELTENEITRDVSSVETFLRSPDGKKFVVDNKNTKNGLVETEINIDGLDDRSIGLWELHVVTKSITNGMQVQRNAKTTFAYSQPNAKLTQTVDITRAKGSDNTLRLSFGIDAVSSGRFELRGTLYGTDFEGKKVPIMFANSAGWREAGTSTLDLTFELSKLGSSSAGKPFEIRDLRLLDQRRMMLLHRQSMALRFQ